MTGKLEGRVALVSGSGRGIGREIALKLASEGARVVVNDLDADPANDTAEAIRAAGGEVAVCAGSVTYDGRAELFVETGVDSFGGLDIIVNNAGYTWDSVVQKMTDEQWRAIIDVHLIAPSGFLRAAQPEIAAKAKEEAAAGNEVFRKVVNISSIAATGGNAGRPDQLFRRQGRYPGRHPDDGEGMGALQGERECGGLWTDPHLPDRGQRRRRQQDFGREQGDQGRRESRPASQMERMIPLGRVGTPQEAAGAVYLFCSPESDFISGQYVICGGGFTI